jgi:ferredoxin
MEIVVIKEKCPQDHSCPAIKVCKVAALKQEGFNAPTVDQDLCIKCMECVNYCPMGAIQAIE